eukprot:4835272-Amphidinium_carterae.1
MTSTQYNIHSFIHQQHPHNHSERPPGHQHHQQLAYNSLRLLVTHYQSTSSTSSTSTRHQAALLRPSQSGRPSPVRQLQLQPQHSLRDLAHARYIIPM